MERLKKLTRSTSAKALGILYEIGKTKTSNTRKLPLLPRVGLVVDIAGYQVSFKFAPLIEAICSLPERGFTAQALNQITDEQFSEIGFVVSKKQPVIDTSARDI